MAIEIVANNQRVWKRVVDYDEIDAFLSGLDYLAKIDYNVTTLPTFVAGYTTKSGFRVGAFTSQRRGAIQFFLQDYSTQESENFDHPGPTRPVPDLDRTGPEESGCVAGRLH